MCSVQILGGRTYIYMYIIMTLMHYKKEQTKFPAGVSYSINQAKKIVNFVLT